MKIKTLSIGVAAAVLVAGPVVAQELDMTLDTNGDGMMSFPEMQAGFPDMTEDMFTLVDTSGDGLLDPQEISDAVAAGLIVPSES